MSDESIPFLIARLGHSEYSERRKAEDALVALGDVAVAPLIAVVEQQGIVAALRAASALSRLGDERGVLPTARLILRENPSTGAVFELLAQWTVRPSAWEIEEVIQLAQDYQISSSEFTWNKLFRCVRQLSPGWVAPSVSAPKVNIVATPGDIPGLIQTLRSTSHALRSSATAKLVALGSDAVPALIEALALASPLVRYRAVEALGQIGDARAVEPLLKLRKTLDTDILQAANAALPVLAHHLATTPRTSEIPQLIALVRHLRFDAECQAAAVSAAFGLETLARTQPTPALRGALKWLKSPWAPLPPSFREARNQIENATAQWKDLPLIADAPQEGPENLPLPASNESKPNHDG